MHQPIRPSRPLARRLALALAVLVAVPLTTVASVSLAADEPQMHTAVTAVSRHPYWIDIFGVKAGNEIYTASRNPDTGKWSYIGRLNGGLAAPDTKVNGVSRFAGRMDIFAVGTDHRVYTAWLEEPAGQVGSMRWQGWEPIGDIEVDKATSVSVVSPNRDTMDLFTVAAAGHRVTTVRWTAQSGWGTWHRVDTDGHQITPDRESEIAAVAPDRDEIHIFATHWYQNPYVADLRPVTNRYIEGVGWSGWQDMTGPQVAFASEITAVSRGRDLIDILVGVRDNKGAPGSISTNRWNGRRWSGFSGLPSGKARYGTSVHAAGRSLGNLDVFLVGLDGQVFTAAWNVTDDGWHGWWPLGGTIASPTSVTAYSRGPDLLDIFAIFPNDIRPWTRRWSPSSGWSEWERIPQ